MANTTLTRPVVTMDLANRSITRFGLIANRVMHPLVARRFEREVGTFTQMSDVKIMPSQTGITVQTELGETAIDLPLYAKLLGKAGVSEIEIPMGLSLYKIGKMFSAIITKTPWGVEKTIFDLFDDWGRFQCSNSPSMTERFVVLRGNRFQNFVKVAMPYSFSSSDKRRAIIEFTKFDSLYGFTTEELDRLSESRSCKILMKVAEHLRTSDMTLIKLAKGGYKEQGSDYYEYDKTSLVAFKRLNLHELTLDQLSELSSSQIQDVLETVATHPQSTPQIKNTAISNLLKQIGIEGTIYHDAVKHLEGQTYKWRYVGCHEWGETPEEIDDPGTWVTDKESYTTYEYSPDMLKHALALLSLVDQEHQIRILTELTASHPKLAAEVRPLINVARKGETDQ
jgi:hypothetical protein